ncbi:MAG: hypothetical protein FD123_1898 [Bacteroidetes bacterium]|nr:MAG: hypothetical protein FD123_1898 [Bacteroidota bacterium]
MAAQDRLAAASPSAVFPAAAAAAAARSAAAAVVAVQPEPQAAAVTIKVLGAGGGGAGGTSNVSGVLNGVTNSGIWLGNGQVSLFWNDPVPPAHTITGSSAICQGDSASYSIVADQYSTFYTWTVPVGLTFIGGQNTAQIDVSGTTPGTYTIYVQGVNGTCSLSGPTDSIMVTVNPTPTVTATAANPTLCAGDSTTVTATTSGVAYLWAPGGQTTLTINVTPASSTTYTVTVVDSNGCTNSATATVNVNALPVVTVTAVDSSICLGGAASLTASGAVSYTWMPGSLTGSSVSVTPTSNTTYTVTGTDSSGCVNMTTLDITVNALPTVTLTSPATVCVGDGNYTLTGSPAGGTFSGTGVTGNSFSPLTAGTGTFTITYNYTDANGCSNSDGNSVTVSSCTGIDDPKNIFGLTFMPNPVSDLLQVRWDGNKGNVTGIEIYDINGRLMISQQVNNETAAEIKVTELPAGNYNLNVIVRDGRATYRFVKK